MSCILQALFLSEVLFIKSALIMCVMVPPVFADLQYKVLGLVCKMCLHQFGSLQVSLDQSQHPRG